MHPGFKSLAPFFAIIATSCFFSFHTVAQDTDISFPSDGLLLNGTLSIPIGDGPFPAVVLVHGSGPNDRDQTITLSDGNSLCLYPDLFGETITTLKDIADYLRGEGILVLRYDKRTFTHGTTLDPVTISTYDFVTDIHAAVDYLKTRPEADTDCLVLTGHSQAATLIPIVARQRADISGLISLAGPSTPIDSLLPEQYRYLYVECANDPVNGAGVANQFYDQFAQIRAGTFPANQQVLVNFPGVPNPIPFGYATFWSDWIDMADSAVINYNLADLPTLLVQGLEDLNVPPADTADFVAGIPDQLLDVATFPGINHFLTPDDESVVDSVLLQTIADWILNGKEVTALPVRQKDIPFTAVQTGNVLRVQWPQNLRIIDATLFTLSGQPIRHAKKPAAPMLEWRTDDLSGVYIVQLLLEAGGTAARKIYLH